MLLLTDYTAVTPGKFDIRHYGRKGMRWGVITSKPSVLADSGGDAAAKALAQGSSTSGEPRQVVGAASGESSPERYARLATQAKSGQAKDFSEQDLKFFNARTEALGKIAKMNEKKPGFLEETVRKVAKQTFQNALQTVATAGANKLLENTLGITPKGKIKDKTPKDTSLKDAAAKIAAAASPKTAATPAVKSTTSLLGSAKQKLAAREAVKTATLGPKRSNDLIAQALQSRKDKKAAKGPVVPNDLFLDLLGSLRK